MKRGTKVKIKGLVKAAVHNGKIGIVTKEQASSASGEQERRVGVKLMDGGKVIAVKIENLEPITTTTTTATIVPEKNNNTNNSSSTMPAIPGMPKERTLKRDNALLREFDGNPDPNVLILYYHFGDREFDCFNGKEYNTQMLRYYDKQISVKLIVPRKIGNNEYFLIGLQHSQHDKNTLCEVAFNCGRSFTGICKLYKMNCFAQNKIFSFYHETNIQFLFF